ncbi:hypothetical protein K7432_003289 [Basidiobolus ranarum]|uniref:BCAS3 WD40 domain-containing protein n=1 Tax=Basidiobolus ranarum TaxID=34480 RepID=A0ABR2W6G0_9FUNG
MKSIATPPKLNEEPENLAYETFDQDGTVSVEPRSVVTCASFDWIEGVYRTSQDHVSDAEKTFTHPQRKFCLILGYHDGFQVWDLSDLSNITEIISCRKEEYDVFCIKNVPTPRATDNEDCFKNQRGILAISMRKTEGAKVQGSTLCFFSLQTHKIVKNLNYSVECGLGVECCERGIVVYHGSTIEVISPKTLQVIFKLNDAHPNSENLPVLSVGNRLLAYVTTDESYNMSYEPVSQDRNGLNVTQVAHEALLGMKSIGDLGYRKLSNYWNSYRQNPEDSRRSQLPQPHSNQVIIFDLDKLGVISLTNTRAQDIRHLCKVGYFEVGEESLDIVAFSPSGSLIAIAPVGGYCAYIYEISVNANDEHLGNGIRRCELYRGYTSAQIKNITFSQDSKWVSINTVRGTSHVYTISPLLGSLNRWPTRLFGETFDSHESPKALKPFLRIRNRELHGKDQIRCDPLLPFSQSGSTATQHHSHQTAMINYFQPVTSEIANIPITATQPGLHLQDILYFSTGGILTLCRITVEKHDKAMKKNGRTYTVETLSGSYSDLVEWSLSRNADWSEVLGVVEGVEHGDTNVKWPDSG